MYIYIHIHTCYHLSPPFVTSCSSTVWGRPRCEVGGARCVDRKTSHAACLWFARRGTRSIAWRSEQQMQEVHGTCRQLPIWSASVYAWGTRGCGLISAASGASQDNVYSKIVRLFKLLASQVLLQRLNCIRLLIWLLLLQQMVTVTSNLQTHHDERLLEEKLPVETVKDGLTFTQDLNAFNGAPTSGKASAQVLMWLTHRHYDNAHITLIAEHGSRLCDMTHMAYVYRC